MRLHHPNIFVIIGSIWFTESEEMMMENYVSVGSGHKIKAMLAEPINSAYRRWSYSSDLYT